MTMHAVLYIILFFYFYANDFYMNVHIVDFCYAFTVDIYMYSQFWPMTLMVFWRHLPLSE